MIDEGNLFKSIYVKSDNATKLFIYLSSKCNEQGLVKDNLSRICDELNFSTKQCRIAVERLEEEGALTRSTSTKNGTEFVLHKRLIIAEGQNKGKIRAEITPDNQSVTSDLGQNKGKIRAKSYNPDDDRGKKKAKIQLDNQRLTCDQGQKKGKIEPTSQPNNNIYLNNIDNNIDSLERGMGETFSDSRSKMQQKQDAMKRREQDFYNALIPFVSVYGKVMIRAFFDYWSEPNRSRTKMKFELQETWDLEKRLSTWERKSNNYGNKTTTVNIADNSREQRLTAVADRVNQLIAEDGYN